MVVNFIPKKHFIAHYASALWLTYLVELCFTPSQIGGLKMTLKWCLKFANVPFDFSVSDENFECHMEQRAFQVGFFFLEFARLLQTFLPTTMFSLIYMFLYSI